MIDVATRIVLQSEVFPRSIGVSVSFQRWLINNGGLDQIFFLTTSLNHNVANFSTGIEGSCYFMLITTHICVCVYIYIYIYICITANLVICHGGVVVAGGK